MEEIAESLLTMGLRFDAILTSPLKRTYETAAIVAKTLKSLDRLEQADELRPEGKRSDFYRKLARLKADSNVLVVGHEPYLGTMIVEIISGSSNSHIMLKKGGLAKVRTTSFLPKASGELRWLLTPKQIRRMS